MTLEKLLEQLKDLRCVSSVSGKPEYFRVINAGSFDEVENLIRQYALDSHDAELGTLQAKVYAYEQIIANSNFAPMIDCEQAEQLQAIIENLQEIKAKQVNETLDKIIEEIIELMRKQNVGVSECLDIIHKYRK